MRARQWDELLWTEWPEVSRTPFGLRYGRFSSCSYQTLPTGMAEMVIYLRSWPNPRRTLLLGETL